jgi:hypothetical protein
MVINSASLYAYRRSQEASRSRKRRAVPALGNVIIIGGLAVTHQPNQSTKLLGIVVFAVTVSFHSAPASAKASTVINQPENRELFASVGDTVIRVKLQESLPNAFGGSDVFGRKRERGSIEIRFIGIRADGRAVFRRKSVDVFSNETTMSPSQSWGTAPNINQSGYGANVAIVNNAGGDATVQVMPGDTIDLALDLPRQNLITVEDRVIEVISADEGGVKFVVKSRAK